MEGSITIEYNMGMQWFRKQQQAGFFDGRALRMARIVCHGAERTATGERTCIPGPDLGQAVEDICRDCDGRIRIVLAEEGVYTFSVSLPLVGNFTRQQVEESLQGCFPEPSRLTLWDYRVVSRGEQESLLEVTEMKPSWKDALSDMTVRHGLIFESIIPESSALASLIAENNPALIVHRKDATSTLLVCCESGKVLASVLVRKADFSVSDIVGFLEFCRQKKQKQVTKLYCSGFESQSLGQLPSDWDVSERVLDPLLGVSLASRWHHDDAELDFSDAVHRPWYRKFFL